MPFFFIFYKGETMLFEQTIKKIKNLIGDPTHNEPDFLMRKNKAAARLKLLNMKGEMR